MESVKELKLNRQDDFNVLYKNPGGARYYQDGMFFGVGGRYLEKHIPFGVLPKDVQAKIKKRGGLRPIMTKEEIAQQGVDFRRFQKEREAFAKEKESENARIATERAELEQMKAELEQMKKGIAPPVKPVEVPEEPIEVPEPVIEEPIMPEPEIYKCEHPGCGKEYKSKKYFDKHLETHK